MRVAITFAILSACLAAPNAAPAKPNAVDWEAMLQKSYETMSFISSSYSTLISMAYNDVMPDNRPLGDRISLLLRGDISSAGYRLGLLNDAIRNGSLRVGQAELMLAQLETVVYDTPRNMPSELSQLTPEVELQIRKNLREALVQVQKHGKAIIRLFIAVRATQKQPDWEALLENANELRELVPRKYSPLISVVYLDVSLENIPIADRIVLLLRSDISRAVLAADSLIGAIKDQSLSLAQVTRMAADVVRVVYDTPRSMVNELTILSPKTGDEVRKALNLAWVESDALRNEIVDQLR